MLDYAHRPQGVIAEKPTLRTFAPLDAMDIVNKSEVDVGACAGNLLYWA